MAWNFKEPRQLALLDDLELVNPSNIMIELSAQQVNDTLKLAGVERLWIEHGLGMTEYVAVQNKGVRFGFQTLVESPNPNHARVSVKSAAQIDPAQAIRELLQLPDLIVHLLDDGE